METTADRVSISHFPPTAVRPTMTLRTCMLAMLTVCASCSGGPDRRAIQDGEPVRETRSWIETIYDTLWTVGGASDSLLGFPSRLTTVGKLVVFSDPGFRRVVALNANDGRVAWIAGGLMNGVHSFEKPLIVTAVGPDTVAMVDDRTRELHLIASDGRLLRSTELPPGRRVNAMCDLAGSGLLISSTDSMGPTYTMDPRQLLPRPFPLGDPALAGRHPLLLQAMLAPRPDRGACVVAMAYGTWIGLTDGKRVLKVASYPENVLMPRIDSTTTRKTVGDDVETTTQVRMTGDTRSSALDVSSTERTIHVLFGGRTPAAGRIIDEYDATSLQYRGSRKLPFAAGAFTVPSPGVAVLVVERNGFPLIIALRERQLSSDLSSIASGFPAPARANQKFRAFVFVDPADCRSNLAFLRLFERDTVNFRLESLLLLGSPDSLEVMTEALAQRGVTVPLRAAGPLSRVPALLGAKGAPFLVVLDLDGVVRLAMYSPPDIEKHTQFPVLLQALVTQGKRDPLLQRP
jgi:hypothetical protein